MGLTGTIEHTEWAIRCGCGEILPQSGEEAARKIADRMNSMKIAERHGTAEVLYRRIVTTDWRADREPANA